MEILIFLIILIILVLVHEGGHFFAAKLSGVRVEEFGFGLPPRLIGKKFGRVPEGVEDDRTLYSINLLPIGGFVRMTGEDSVITDPQDSKSFQNAKLSRRILIVLAGVFMNFILGFILFVVVYSFSGIPSYPREFTISIVEVAQDSPAYHAGLQAGDVLVSIDNHAVKRLDDFIVRVEKKAGQEIVLRFVRDTTERTVQLVPRVDPPRNEGPLGMRLQEKMNVAFYDWYLMPFYAIVAGLRDTAEMVRSIVPALGKLVQSLVLHREVSEQVVGPVGIAKASSFLCTNTLSCLYFAGLLSMNLALFNLLPIPALDGGRLVFLLYEFIFGKRANAAFEQWTHALGFVLLLILIIFVTYNDITSDSPFPSPR